MRSSRSRIGLNPSSNGIPVLGWISWVELTYGLQVLILLLMEYPLWEVNETNKGFDFYMS